MVGLQLTNLYYLHQTHQSLYKFQGYGKEKCSIIPQGGEVTTLDLEFAGAGETRVIGVESITYKYVNGKLYQEYGATWGVSSSQLPQGSQLEVSEANATLTITVPANNTSSTRSGKVVLIQQASGKTITINLSQTTSIQNNGIIIYVYSDPSTQGKGVIQVIADHPVASTLAINLDIQYGVSSGDRRTYNLTLAKGQYLLINQKFDIQIGAYPQVLSYSYNPKEDSTYRYSLQIG